MWMDCPRCTGTARTRAVSQAVAAQNAGDCDQRRHNDPRYHAINNPQRQGLDQETGRTNVAAALSGDGYFEKTNPDVGSDTFRRTAKKGKHATRKAHEISAEQADKARWSGKLHTKDFVRANKLAAKKGEFVRGAAGRVRRSASASAAPVASRSVVGSDGRVYGNVMTTNGGGGGSNTTRTVGSTATRSARASKRNLVTTTTSAMAMTTSASAYGNHAAAAGGSSQRRRPQSASVHRGERVTVTGASTATRAVAGRPQSARVRGSERWEEWDTFTERGANIRRGASTERGAATRTRAAGDYELSGFIWF
jgi:hypothetical protein